MPDVRDRNVYSLGAGFSATAGAPVVRDFIDSSRKFFDDPNSQLDPVESNHFEVFLEFKRRMSQAREKIRIDLDDIEQLFGLVEISQRLEPQLRDTRTSTVYVIAKTLEVATRLRRTGRIRFDSDAEPNLLPRGVRADQGFGPGTYNLDLYDYFAALASGRFDKPEQRKSRINTFITFNYDLVLDDALRRIGVAPEYFLPPELTQSEEFSVPQDRCAVLKLHGSTNWGICSNPQCGRQVLRSQRQGHSFTRGV